MSKPTRNRQPVANRLFVSASTLAFAALMAAVVLAVHTGRF